MTLELDHIFCMVAADGAAASRLEAAGWLLDAGTAHAGQGTRNRRLAWPEQYLELLWVADDAEARANPLRLDRRAEWTDTGASPFGFALRGRLPDADMRDYWRYEGLGAPIWVHRDNERASERPLVFVLEATGDELEQRRPRSRAPDLLAHRRPGALRSIHVTGPAPASLPRYDGPAIEYSRGSHLLELVVGNGTRRRISDILVVSG
jgi:hypothetical protein